MCVNERRGHENSSKHKQQLHTQLPLTSFKPFPMLDTWLWLYDAVLGFCSNSFIYFQMQSKYFSWMKWSQVYLQAPASSPGSVLSWGSLPVVWMSGFLLEWSQEYLHYEVISCFGSVFTSVADGTAHLLFVPDDIWHRSRTSLTNLITDFVLIWQDNIQKIYRFITGRIKVEIPAWDVWWSKGRFLSPDE